MHYSVSQLLQQLTSLYQHYNHVVIITSNWKGM